MAGERQFCTFFVNGHYFGLDVTRVQEVLRHQAMTRVPLADPVVRGLINLRGQIVTAIDLRRRLGYPDGRADLLPVNIIVRTDDGAVSLLVDEIGDVLEVSETQFERPPETLRGKARDLVCGAYKLAGRLLLILDTDRAVEMNSGREADQQSPPGPERPHAGDRQP